MARARRSVFLPRSRGGGHVWENVVSCCRRCNHAKADRAISELGWRMLRQPAAPTGIAWRVLGTGRMNPQWRPYLGDVDDFLYDAEAATA